MGYWFSIRIPHHWLRKKPIPQTTTFLIRHLGFRFVRSYGSLLSYDGLLTPLRFLSDMELWLTMIYINEFVVPLVRRKTLQVYAEKVQNASSLIFYQNLFKFYIFGQIFLIVNKQHYITRKMLS